jgi:cytochrome c-type biogenesis protein CcmH
MFYLFAVLLALVAILFILVPLVRNHSTPAAQSARRLTTQAANLDAFRTQKRELDADLANGIITAGEHSTVAAELSQRLENELAADKSQSASATLSKASGFKPKWGLAAALSLFVACSAAAGYSVWGTPDFKAKKAEAIAAQAANPAGNVGSAGNASADAHDGDLPDKKIVELVDQLAKKMEENPSDPKGWILLARSQNAIGQFGLAVKSFERAVALTPDDAQLIADYADTLAMTQKGEFTGKPMELVNRALKVDPKNMKALALAGTAMMRAGDKAASLSYWEKLQALVPKDTEDYAQVSAIINEVKTGKPAFPRGAATENAQTAPAQVAANATQTKATSNDKSTAEKPTASAGKSVSGTVTIAAALRGKVSPNDTLFVFARAVNGPKMPLAVLRIPVPGAWPYNFTLTDQMAMAPGMNLSSFPEVTVEARISKVGNAQLQPGDLSGSSAALKPPARDVTVTIQTVAP